MERRQTRCRKQQSEVHVLVDEDQCASFTVQEARGLGSSEEDLLGDLWPKQKEHLQPLDSRGPRHVCRGARRVEETRNYPNEMCLRQPLFGPETYRPSFKVQ